MADHHHHLLVQFLTTCALLPILLMMISTQASEHDAVFSDPIQILFGGESLTDGQLTLTLGTDCSLRIYDAGVLVEDFDTSVSTSHCALLVNSNGQIALVPDNELTTTNIIGRKTTLARYALLVVEDKVGIFGPAMWTNGIGKLGYDNEKIQSLTGAGSHPKLRTGRTDYLLLSGESVTGSANGNVVLAESGTMMSAVITPRCSISVLFNGTSLVWRTPRSHKDMKCVLQLKTNGELVMTAFDDAGSPYVHWSGGHPSKENRYVCLLRYNGEIVIYRLKTWLYDGLSSLSSSSSAVDAAGKIKMVTTGSAA